MTPSSIFINTVRPEIRIRSAGRRLREAKIIPKETYTSQFSIYIDRLLGGIALSVAEFSEGGGLWGSRGEIKSD